MLAGRHREHAAVVAVLDAARAGRGGALVVRGMAGSGKSALLEEAVRDVAGITVLRTAGVESESPLAFAALQRLLRPLLRNRLARLPAPQRAALRCALGEADGDGDRFLTFLGALSLLAAASDETPVAVVVDDAHWLDDASAAALLFAARRIQAERVALLFAAREGDARRLDSGDLPTVVLSGLAGVDADALLAARGGVDVDPGVREEVVAATGGNPLALVELAEVLTGDQLAGRSPLPQPLPLTAGVQRSFGDRYRRLDGAAQRLLLVAAADDTGRLTVVHEAARRLDAGDAALEAVERSGLLRVEGEAVHLYHPLVRTAVYRGASSTQRRAAHRALADVLGDDADRRAWHLAAAADRPDADVAAALDGVATRAAARGGHEAAAAAWARAAELTPGGPVRGRRLHQAASSAWLGARPSRAGALATAAAADVSDPLVRARLLVLRGQVEWNTRSLDDGYDLVLQAAEIVAGIDAAFATELAMLAASLAAFGARSPRPVRPNGLVGEPAPDAPMQQRAAWALLHGFEAVSVHDWAAAARSFRSAFTVTEARTVDDLLQANLGIAAFLVDDDERGLRLHEDQLTAARTAGALSAVEHALTRGFPAQLATGAWSRAAAAAAEARSLAVGSGHPGLTALPTAELALMAALRGDPGAEQLLGEAEVVRAAHPVGVTDGLAADLAHWARGVLTATQPALALHHLGRMTLPALRRMSALDLLDAAARAERPEAALPALEELRRFAADTGSAAAVAVVEHGRALVGDGDPETRLRRALEAHARSPRLPDRARTHLALGEHLRRARRRVDARDHLRAALTLFSDLGAAPLAERAEQELRAAGETARRRDVSTATALTPQERQVATLVRRGLSNRDAAAQLFVSPRTVDFHLRNVFTKLGVASRGELAALPLDR